MSYNRYGNIRSIQPVQPVQPYLQKEIVNDDTVLKAVNISNKPTPTLSPALLPSETVAAAISRTNESAGNALAALGNAATAIGRTTEPAAAAIGGATESAATTTGGATHSAGNVLGALDTAASAISRTTSEFAANTLTSAKTLVESESHQQTQSGFRSHFFDTKTTKTT